MKNQDNTANTTTTKVLVRWGIETLSDTVQSSMTEDGVLQAHILGETVSMECLDRNGILLGERPITEIDEYAKDVYHRRRREKGFRFNLFRWEGNEAPRLYFEWALGTLKSEFKFARSNRRIGVIKGSSFLRTQTRREARSRATTKK